MNACAVVDIGYFKVFLGHSEKPFAVEKSYKQIWKRFTICRAVCMISRDDKYRESGKISGPGHVVEIDHVEITSTSSWICGLLHSKSFPPCCGLCDRCSHEYHRIAMEIEFINQTKYQIMVN